MPRLLHYTLILLTATLLIAGPLGYASYRHAQLRNFRVVRDGVLYRSGQMSVDGLKRVVHDYGIKTVITLRDAYQPGEPVPAQEEEAYCRDQEINYYRIPPRNWWAVDGPPPVEEGVRK